MTNAEKYLKEGINKEELSSGIAYAFFGECSKCDIARLKNFFNEQVKPTLTEDERVILHYIDNRYTHIQRDCGLWIVNCEDEFEILSFEMYSHLFQFIKERRRIRDRRIIERRIKMDKKEIVLTVDQVEALIGLLKEHLSIYYKDVTFNAEDVIRNQFYEQLLIELYRCNKNIV